MLDLHLAYQNTGRIQELLSSWDAQVAAEDPIIRRRWTDIALWPAARNATVAGSTGIEGNPLTPAQVGEVLSGGRVDASPSDIREVFNYNAALDLANRAALRPDFEWSQELIRRLNAAILEDLEDDERGEYRQQPVTVGGAFHPPEPERLPALMADLVQWLRDANDGHALTRAGLTHLNLVAIHPWINGNGRAARVVGSLMLMRSGVGSPELLNVESEIRANRERYFAVLQETHGASYEPSQHSATPWLEYFAEICVNRLGARNRLMAALPADIGLLVMELDGARETAEWPAVLLSARLAPIRTTQMATSLGLSPGRMRAILAAMADAGWLLAIGERRGRRYGPSRRLSELPLRTPELMDLVRGSEGGRSADAQGTRATDLVRP